MKEAVSFSPGHITGLFKICDQPSNPLKQGSLGSGVSISKGVTSRVQIERAKKMSCEIKINNEVETAKVSKHVLDTFLSQVDENYNILINHEVEIPIGSGLGSSGAGALSLSLALNEVFELGLSRIEAAQIAHIAEVNCKTGLGTVIAETYGGLEIRVKPGAPGVGELMQIPLDGDYCVAYLNLGTLFTDKILIDNVLRKQINEFGEKFLHKLVLSPTPHKFMEMSRSFAERIGLLSERMKQILKETDEKGYQCSMAMFGELIFALIERDSVKGLLNIFNKHRKGESNMNVVEIDCKGARLL